MSIKTTQVIDRETLNRAFVSKSATGTQIMAGGLRLLGGLTIDGTTSIASLLAGSINAGTGTITTTGAIAAGTFSGSGAALTALNASNLASGTVASARLPSTVFYTNTSQTITANTTMNANLYLANGTTYYINSTADAKFKNLESTGILTVNGSNHLTFGSNGVGGPAGAAGLKIDLYDGRYSIGVDSAIVWYNSVGEHHFYSGGSTLQALVNNEGVTSSKDVVATRDLEVRGEIKAGIANEFPDPLLATGGVGKWGTPLNGSVAYSSTQIPFGTNASGSLKLTATGLDNYIYYEHMFDATPNEWITFSAYVKCATAKTLQLYITWYQGTTLISSSGNSYTTKINSFDRYKWSAQAPATATGFKVRIDNEGGTGIDMYCSAFQVERGRSMTGFKPFAGSSLSASFTSEGIMLGKNKSINSAYNNKDIVKDYTNGNVTLNAAGGNLYLGYQNTTSVFLSSNLTTEDSVKIADTLGKLYYQGSDIDARYLKLSGGTVTGATTFSGNAIVNGNLGVKQATPAYPLDVNGDARITGAIQSPSITSFLNGGNAQGIKVGNLVVSNSYSNAAPTNGLYVQGDIDAKAKLFVASDTRISTKLEVGTGVSGNDLAVTSGGTLNFRNTLYSELSRVGVNTTSPNNPLHVYSSLTHQGINIQTSSDSLTNGLSFQNSGGTYSWHMARVGTNTTPDLVFYSGANATMSSLSESVRMKNGGGLTIQSPNTIGLSSAGNGGLIVESAGVQLAMDPNEIFFTGSGDNYIGTIGSGSLNFYLGGASRVKFNNNGTTQFLGTMAVTSTVTATSFINEAGDGNSVRYWGSTAYSTYMSTSANATHGGKLSWVASDDYNMYFKMTSNNRGFAFSNPTQGGVNAQIEGNGRVNSKVGFRADKFEMAYNATEDSLDFIYHG